MISKGSYSTGKSIFFQIRNSLFGIRDTTHYERYIMRVICFVCVIFLFFLSFVNLFSHPEALAFIIPSIATIILVILYLLVRFTDLIFVSKIILSFFCLIALDFAWLSESYSLGPNLLFIFSLGSLFIWIWKGKQLRNILILYFLNIILLFLFEFSLPEIDIIYPNQHARTIEIYISFAIYTSLSILLLYKVKVDFNHQFEEAKRSDQEKSAFLNSMSHEIRTPMNAIVGFGELLKTEKRIERRTEYIKMINDSSDRLLSLINDIFDIATIDNKGISLEFDSFSIQEVFDGLLGFYKDELKHRGKENIKICYSLPDPKLLMYSDKHRIIQILSHLIHNSVKFTLAGEINFNCIVMDSNIIFEVSDTGIGVPDEEKDKIFESFVKYNHQGLNIEGTGIGLTIVREVTKMLNGKISFSSKINHGSKFNISLPIITPDKTESNNFSMHGNQDSIINNL